ncbi:MAG TPA: hypothetical protein VNC78_07885 [Actinomycetota bacterium]|nr:hypothetical protein [Actinomycetota bacterium]
MLKTAGRLALLGIVAACAFIFDREGWAGLVGLSAWAALLTTFGAMVDWRREPRPTADMFLLLALSASITIAAGGLGFLLWHRSVGATVAVIVCIFVMTKVLIDFVNRPLPWEKAAAERAKRAPARPAPARQPGPAPAPADAMADFDVDDMKIEILPREKREEV